ncbi:ISAs1 family transposase [Pararhodobacter sp. SW119]|uniref:ISAs1 family transposase n=1 Tax=Pararhodobacter sp. SW119 TaxID=2780075 RepID=UPI001AE031BB|nr:ISAs1 family transposase [Pararhodobacter sp. SW119]
MSLDSSGCGAVSKSIVFLRYFEDLPDPRQRAKVMYPLPEVLLLCLLAVLAGAETITDIVRFGEAKLALLRRFRPFAEGTPGRTESETRFYITSLTLPADQIGAMVRDHWAVENSLHWVMDMVFRDDECRLRTDNAPANFTTIKHIALNVMRRGNGQDSLHLKRKVAAWDDEYLASLIAR